MRIDSLEQAAPFPATATSVKRNASHISGFAKVRRTLSARLELAANLRASRSMADAQIMRDIGLPRSF